MVPLAITFDGKVNDLDEKFRTSDGGFNRKDVLPGASFWVTDLNERVAVLRFSCPHGCGDIISVPVYTGPTGYGWKWNGSKEKPTLSPSIQKLSGCRWHGHLEDGFFKD